MITPGVVSVDYPYGKPVTNAARMDDIKYIYKYSVFANKQFSIAGYEQKNR